MVLGCLLGGVALLGLVGWLLLRGRLAGRLLEEKHLLETAEALEAVKRAALERPIASPADFAPLPRDPRVLATSAGLLLFYTVSRLDRQYNHHLSLSAAGGYLPRVAGETLLLYFADLLGIPYNRLQLSVSPTTVRHAEFVLDEKEQAELARRRVAPLAEKRLPELRKDWLLARETLTWERLMSGKT